MMQPTVEQLTVQEEPITKHSMVTRSQAGVHKPNPKYLYNVEKIPIEPKPTKLAMQHPGWLLAIKEELDAFRSIDACDL